MTDRKADPEPMNLYPEQLRQIAAMCEALNTSEMLPDAPEMGIQFKYGIPLVTPDGDYVGELIDEVGGAWSFQSSTDAAARARQETDDD